MPELCVRFTIALSTVHGLSCFLRETALDLLSVAGEAEGGGGRWREAEGSGGRHTDEHPHLLLLIWACAQ